MFGWLKKRERAEHLKLMRQTIERAEELLSFSEKAASLGLDPTGGATNDAIIYRSLIEDMKPMLYELEHTEGALIPHEAVGQVLSLWKDFGARLDAIEHSRKAARKHLGV